MPLILASLTNKVTENENPRAAHTMYLFISAFTTLGLIAWEFIQINSRNLYFDLSDIGATFVGTFLAYASYQWSARLKTPNQPAA